MTMAAAAIGRPKRLARNQAGAIGAVMAKLGVTILPWTAAHVELDEHKLKLAKVDHPLFSRDLSLCWHDTALLSNAVQKVKATILEVFDSLGKRPEWIGAD